MRFFLAVLLCCVSFSALADDSEPVIESALCTDPDEDHDPFVVDLQCNKRTGCSHGGPAQYLMGVVEYNYDGDMKHVEQIPVLHSGTPINTPKGERIYVFSSETGHLNLSVSDAGVGRYRNNDEGYSVALKCDVSFF